MRECPPSLPFVLAVGVTGHRRDALAVDAVEALKSRLREVLVAIAATANDVRRANCEFFSDAPLRLLFVSPLADGADQIGAAIALELGFELHAILPFDRDRSIAFPAATLACGRGVRAVPCRMAELLRRMRASAGC